LGITQQYAVSDVDTREF